MAKAPQKAYESLCQRTLKGAYFPSIQHNEQVTQRDSKQLLNNSII